MKFQVVVNAVNELTHLVMDTRTGRCLGGAGSNFYRCYAFPLYTPGGLTVLQEFAFDHPFHNGLFVGQHPVVIEGREANFWVAPPCRAPEEPLYAHMGRVQADKDPRAEPHERGVRFTFRNVWLDENEKPVLDEVRTVHFHAAADATICDMTSEKIAAYGAVQYPQTKYGGIGVRVEPRLLPPLGGIVLVDGGKSGTAAVAHESDSAYVAYENEWPDHGRFGVLISVLGGQDENTHGAWFARDYGLALWNPTLRRSIATPRGESWTVGLRVVAYDGALNEERARRWMGAGIGFNQ